MTLKELASHPRRLRIDGGLDGFAERAVSLIDLAWVIQAAADVASAGGLFVRVERCHPSGLVVLANGCVNDDDEDCRRKRPERERADGITA